MDSQKTPLYDSHVKMGGKIVDFSGWAMPIHYGSQLDEHHQVRKDAGMFDVSHMTVLDIKGNGAKAYLSTLLANNIGKLSQPGKALYSCMLNEAGGVIDDLITYYLNDLHYRTVVNAATHDKDLAWLTKQADKFDVEITERTDLAMIAIQGPNARDKAAKCLSPSLADKALSLKPFFAVMTEEYFVARTGYTGEDGFEIMLPAAEAAQFWQQLADHGVKPSGLGARDTLRLEAGMNLYGTDMDESISPLECGLAWTVALEPSDRDFIGRKALEEKQKTNTTRFVGLVLESRGVLRNHQKVVTIDTSGQQAFGEITSGSFSPTLNKAIALARIPQSNANDCFIEIRDKQLPAKIVKPVFVRNGKDCISDF